MSTPPLEHTGAGATTGRVRIVITGAGGRMGSRLAAIAQGGERFEIVAALEGASSPALGRAAAPDSARGAAPTVATARENQAFPGIDAVVDFSSPAGALVALSIAAASGAALLVGTTGLPPDAIATLRAASARMAVLLAPNTSLGVAALARLVRQAAAMLGPGYDCSIVEAHHNQKKDAPSGTALRLAEAAIDVGAPLRPDQVVSIRGGDVIGEHTVRFAGAGEYIELVHRATSRDLFARGALTAAAWLKGRPPGWYTMEDVLAMGGT
jgi:4-hydroxy-tetrahydrodipicolinate reductase